MICLLALLQCGCGEYTTVEDRGAVKWWVELQSETEGYGNVKYVSGK